MLGGCDDRLDAMTSDAQESSSAKPWQAVAIVAVLPGMAHLVVVTMGLVGIVSPAVWISDHLLVGTWSVPVLWTLVIGGPLLSVLARLTLELWEGQTRSAATVLGLIAWVLLIIGLVTTLPLPWILVFE